MIVMIDDGKNITKAIEATCRLTNDAFHAFPSYAEFAFWMIDGDILLSSDDYLLLDNTIEGEGLLIESLFTDSFWAANLWRMKDAKIFLHTADLNMTMEINVLRDVGLMAYHLIKGKHDLRDILPKAA